MYLIDKLFNIFLHNHVDILSCHIKKKDDTQFTTYIRKVCPLTENGQKYTID